MNAPHERTTVEVLEDAARYIGERTQLGVVLLERASRLRNVLKVAAETGDPKEPFDNGKAAMFAAYELARKLDAPGPSPVQGTEAGERTWRGEMGPGERCTRAAGHDPEAQPHKFSEYYAAQWARVDGTELAAGRCDYVEPSPEARLSDTGGRLRFDMPLVDEVAAVINRATKGFWNTGHVVAEVLDAIEAHLAARRSTQGGA